MFLHVKARPNAKQNLLLRLPDGTLQVRIKAPAQDGRANEELVKFLGELLGIPKSKIVVASGHTAPFKKLAIDAEEAYVKKKLEEAFQR
jgi:uncharacterized protein (TIGR00251 family)